MNKIQKIIIKKLADGYSQYQVAEYLKVRGISPNSLSMIEKELLKLRKSYGALTLVHLFIILVRKGELKL